MLAAVLVSPNHFEIHDVAIPKPGPCQVRVKLEGCGVCASNIPLWEGRPWFCYPFADGAPGHEGWGRIDAIGSEVTGPCLGERVGILSTNAYAEYDLAEISGLVRLPESMDDQPFPAEPLGCAVNVFRRSVINKGDTVAIVGVGFLGALLTQLASLAEARVIAIGRRPYALRIAEQLGAAHTVAIEAMEEREGVVETVRKLNNGNLCDIVIEATGKGEPLNLAGELTRERGRLVIAGYHQDGPREINVQLWNRRGLDVINAHECSPLVYLEGMREAVGAVDSGLVTPAPLYTHWLTLDRLDEALQLSLERPEGFMKALIRY